MFRSAHVPLLLVGIALAACFEHHVGGGSDSDAGSDSDSDTDADTDADTDTDACPGWLDTESGLCWEHPLGNPSELSWDAADGYCNTLGDGSWVTPNIDDLRTLIDPGPDQGPCQSNVTGGSCGVTENPECLGWSCVVGCETCEAGHGPDDEPEGCYWKAPLSGPCYYYWSTSPNSDETGERWRVSYANGGVYSDQMSESSNVRCVRQ